MDNEPSLSTSDRPIQSTVIMEGVVLSRLGFGIESDLNRGCWILMAYTQGEFTRLKWGCCQAAAEAIPGCPCPQPWARVTIYNKEGRIPRGVKPENWVNEVGEVN